MFSVELKNKLLRNMSPESIKELEGRIKRINKLVGSDPTNLNVNTLVNVHLINRALIQITNLNSKISTLYTLIKIIPYIAPDKVKVIDRYNQMYRTLILQAKDNQSTARVGKSLVVVGGRNFYWNQIYQKWKSYKGDTNSIEYIVLSLYAFLPPEKISVFQNMVAIRANGKLDLLTNTTPYNLYDIDSRLMVIRYYPLAHRLGTIRFRIGKTLAHIIERWTKHMTHPRFILQTNRHVLRSSDATKMFHRILPGISINEIRKAYASQYQSAKYWHRIGLQWKSDKK